MPRVVYYCATSLDGFIAEADDTLEWLMGYEGSYDGEAPPVEGGYDEFYEGVGAMVSGSATYEFVLDHMAKSGSEWAYRGKPYWLLTSRDLPTPPGDDVDVRMVSGAIRPLFDEMVASAGDRDLWIVGGGNIASQFADEGLLDALEVTVVPAVLGEGKPLFDRRLPAGSLKLTAVLPRPSGMVELRYETIR